AGSRRSTRSKLNPHFRFRFQSGFAHQFDQPKPVIGRNREESSRNFDDVEAYSFAFANVFANRVAALDQHALDKPTSGNEHIVFMTELDDISHASLRH